MRGQEALNSFGDHLKCGETATGMTRIFSSGTSTYLRISFFADSEIVVIICADLAGSRNQIQSSSAFRKPCFPSMTPASRMVNRVRFRDRRREA